MKLLVKFKYIALFALLFVNVISCTDDNNGCETETVCFGSGNCVERPKPGTCFN